MREASSVVVAVDRDDAAVLATLTARELNSEATIVAAVREEENVHLLHQSGASSVITSSGAAGRLLGHAVHEPRVTEVLEDLLSVGEGLDIAHRPVEESEVGPLSSLNIDRGIVVGVIRDEELIRFDDPRAGELQRGRPGGLPAQPPRLAANGASILVAVHRLRRERRETDGHVLGALGRRVAHPLAASHQHTLARRDLQRAAVLGLDLERPGQYDRYSSNSGRCPGSLQPAGERIRATLARSSPLLARPANSSISFGGVPAASMRTGVSIGSGIRASA